ncbi:MAG: V-type ATPase 116kDa subunit family protein [Firmicutes bacterium]|nr:V-type ATPase 116kDa subunit family protein [Bacillota bacterium]
MAITKMVAVTIAGKVEEFENVVDKYVYNRSIHLENAMSVLGDYKRLSVFDESTQYDDVVKTAEDILKLANIPLEIDKNSNNNISIHQMKEELESISSQVAAEKEKRDELMQRRVSNDEAIGKLALMKSIDDDVSKVFKMEYIKARFGHIPRGGYKMLNTYLNELECVFVETFSDENDVWGFYFAPASRIQKVDEIFTSLYFERITIPGDVDGNPQEMQAELILNNKEITKQIDELAQQTKKLLSDSKEKLIQIYSVARKRQQFADVRSSAAHSKDFFYIVGWMSEKDAKALQKQVDADNSIVLFYTESAENMKNIITPPTKLKNNPIFRPFEFFVKMYGMPGYTEFDPTPLLAITYILFFGMMFGDVGQSAVLAILGFLVYKFKKIDLANIIGVCGLSGIIFGFLYGSIFGREDIIKGVLTPMDNIQTMLIGTIAIGIVIIIIGMCLNVRNCFDKKDYGEMIFGHNGIAGIIFYVSVILFALSKLTGFIKLSVMPMIVLMVISLLMIFMSEPLSNLVNGKKDWMPKGGMFYVQSFFELFEVLLSYFSNTISFLRIGAFAIVHVGMMMAVELLAQGGPLKVIIVSIIGNILVMVMEGLVVGIQVLRLEYYEMFSRYFTGNGKPFRSLKIK